MASRYEHWHTSVLIHLYAPTNTPSSVASLVPSSSDSSSAGKLPPSCPLSPLRLPIEHRHSTDTLPPSSYKLVAIKLVTPGKEHLEAHCS